MFRSFVKGCPRVVCLYNMGVIYVVYCAACLYYVLNKALPTVDRLILTQLLYTFIVLSIICVNHIVYYICIWISVHRSAKSHINNYYYIPNCKRPITLHHSYHVTAQYPPVLYGRYWTVVIAQLSAVDLPCKVNDKSRWPRKASELRCWFISFDRL